MRKWFLLTCCIGMLIPSMTVAAQTEDTSKKSARSSSQSKTEAVHPYKYKSNITNQFTHWSLAFEGGISLFDGDFAQKNILPASGIRPSGALSLTYDFTPVWGLSLQYAYNPYGVKAKEANDWILQGQMHLAELFLNFDLVDAWFPKRKTDIFSAYLLAGAGVGFYDAEYFGELEGDKYAKSKATTAPVVSLGLAAEFNVSQSIGLGLKGLYHIATTDVLDTKIEGSNNDIMESVSLYLRWKIGANKKNHPRNYADDNALRNLIDLQSNKGGAARKAQKDTVVVYHRDTIVAQGAGQWKTQEVEAAVKQQLQAHHLLSAAQSYYVYFSTNSETLSASSLQTIQQVADRLAAEPELCLEIVGYCDNTGSAKYNELLGKKRAERVVRELTRVYKVDAGRLVTISGGQIDNVKSAYGPNRRVELRLRSQEEIQKLRKDPQPKVAPKAASKAEAKAPVKAQPAPKATPKAEPAKPAAQPAAKPAPKAEPAKPAAQPAAKPAPKAEPAKPAAQPAAKPAPKAEPAKPAAQPAAKPAPKAEPAKPAAQPAAKPAPKAEPAKPAAQPATKPAPKAEPAQPAAQPAAKATPASDTSREVLATVRANQYTTFARLARQYYNNVYCWPYIYAANRHVTINDVPDKIIQGATIKVPKLTPKEIRECTERRCLEMVQTIQSQPK